MPLRDHPSRKKITYKCLKNIYFDELSNDLSNIDFKMECIDVNLVVDNYNSQGRIYYDANEASASGPHH